MKTIFTIICTIALSYSSYSKSRDYMIGNKYDTMYCHIISYGDSSLTYYPEGADSSLRINISFSKLRYFKLNKEKYLIVDRRNKYTLVKQESDEEDLMPEWPMKDNNIFYSGVLNVDSVSKMELYRRAKRYIVENYKSGKDVIQLDDPLGYEVIGKGNYKVICHGAFGWSMEIYVEHTMKVSCKDGKYRYEITGMRDQYFLNSTQYTRAKNVDEPLLLFDLVKGKYRLNFFGDVDLAVKKEIADIEKAMKSNANNEW